MRNDQADEYFHHEARAKVLGFRPLTWAQFCRIACQIEAKDNIKNEIVFYLPKESPATVNPQS
jgi:hypothetical protein